MYTVSGGSQFTGFLTDDEYCHTCSVLACPMHKTVKLGIDVSLLGTKH